MADQLSLELVEKGLVCSQFLLDIGYDAENLSAPAQQRSYHGLTKTDRYGRAVPAAAHGSANLPVPASSARILMQTAAEVFDRIADSRLSVRRVTVTAAGLLRQEEAQLVGGDQLDFFGNYAAHQQQKAELERELSGQQAIVALRQKYGKNAVLRGMDLQEGATTKTGMAKLAGTKRRTEETKKTLRFVYTRTMILRGAEICVGVIAHGKCRNYNFAEWTRRRALPPEAGMIRSVGTKT